MFQSSNFFYGVVESRADPLKLGRCKVRVMGVHTENTTLLPTKDLPWAVPMQPITSAGVSGMGHSPTGVVEGSWVVVFFRDGQSMQEPIMMGTIAGIPEGKDQSLSDPYHGKAGTIYDGLKDITDISTDQEKKSEKGLTDGNSSDIIGGLTGNGNNVLQQVESADSIRKAQSTSQPLGKLSERYNQIPSASITDADSVKGLSYGKYQIPSYMRNGGSLSARSVGSPIEEFISSSSEKDKFLGLVPSTKEFNEQWKESSKKEQFQNEQRDFIQATKYTPAVNNLRADGKDLTGRGPAVQELIFSTVTEYGSESPITRALKDVDISSMTDGEIIQAVQESKIANLEKDYKDEKKREIQKGRLQAEQSRLVDYSRESGSLTKEEIEALKKKSNGTISASGVAVPRTIPENSKNGFSDPFGIYPRQKWLNEQDTSRLARADKTDETILRTKNQTVVRNIGTAGGGSWDEPKSPYAAQYPLNHVWQTESGHVQEFDDTPNAERIHLYHRAGSFVEFHPDGSVVYKSVKNQYEITISDRNILVGGNCNITVKGDANIYSQGMLNLESDGDMTIKTGSNLFIGAEGKAEIVSNGDMHVGSNGNLHEGAKNIMMNCSWYPSGVSAGDHAVGKIQVQVYDDDESVPNVSPLDESAAASEALNNGSIPTDVKAPTKRSDGTLVSSEVQPDPDMEDIKKSKADDKETKCNGEDALGSDALSTNYKLSDLTTSPVLSKVSLRAQAGLTKCEIFDNLSALAKNVMEPLRSRYGSNFIITSAFRQMGSNGKSQHPKGQAVDIQFPRLSATEYVHRIEEISRVLPDFDQMILEYHGNNPVIHISYNSNGNRRQKKTTPDLKRYFTGFRDRAMGLVYE